MFDEADALVGKRSEVKDSHKRSANIELAYLLERMEVYPDLAILTTNQKETIDTALRRRIRTIGSIPVAGRETACASLATPLVIAGAANRPHIAKRAVRQLRGYAPRKVATEATDRLAVRSPRTGGVIGFQIR